MKLKKDFFLDTLYSILFAILIQVDNASLNKENLALVFILRNLILISILVLWLKALSRNKAGVILVTDAPSKNTGILKIGFKMLSQFIGMKLCCFLLIFCSFSLFTDRFEFDALQRYSLQIVTIGFYTLSVLLICMAYLKISINDWRFVLVILGPFFLLFLIYGVFGLSNYIILPIFQTGI